MEIIDHKNGIPLEYYLNSFSKENPEYMSNRSGILYENGFFNFTLLNRKLILSWPDMIANYTDNGNKAKSNIRILLARRIMEGKSKPFFGKMLAYTEMPWGNVYEQQFKGRCLMRLAFGYGNDLNKFKSSCLRLGGREANSGDISFDIPFLDNLLVRLIIWEGDEEFPPSAQILFSDNFSAAFSAEDIAVTGDIILDAMKDRW